MHTMDSSLKGLYEEGIITYEDAAAQARNMTEFEQMVGDNK